MLSAIIFFGLTFPQCVLMVCPESISTLSVVSHCPSNATEWVSAAKRKSCNDLGKVQSCTEPDQFVYHCVLNQEATQLLEVCAPVWFLSGYCARFSEVDKRIINDPGLDCTKFDPPCPSRFLSNESFKYQMCYRGASLNNHQQNGAADFITYVLLGIVALLVLTLLILLFVGFKLKRYECARCCGKKRTENDIQSSEGEELLDQSIILSKETKDIEEVPKSIHEAKKRISYRNLSGNIEGSCSLTGIKTICDLRGKLSKKLRIPKDILFVVYEEKGILFDDDTEIKTLKVFPIELMIGNQNRMNDSNIAGVDGDNDDTENDVLSEEFTCKKYTMDCGHSRTADSLLAWTKDRLFHHTDTDLLCPECSSPWDLDKISEVCRLSPDEKRFFQHVENMNKCNKMMVDVAEYEFNRT